MDERIEKLFSVWEKRNIQGLFAQDKKSAAEKILNLIPQSATIGISGSVSLDEIGVIKELEIRGNYVFNPYKQGLSGEESLRLRRQGALEADYYLASPNGVSQTGELVFLSAYGNRTSGIAFAKNVILVCGINKITENLEGALKRSRSYATPLNCKRLNWNSACFADGVCHQEGCQPPDFKRMCCQTLIIEAEALPDRMSVLMVGESLGF